MLSKNLILKYTVLSLFSVFFSACKNDKSKEIDLPDHSEKTVNAKADDFISRIRTITPSEVAKYGNNLQIMSGESTFDNISQKISLKIPVSNANFRFLEKHDVSSSTITAILYVITDDTQDTILSENMTHILEDRFDMSFIAGQQVKNNKLVVFVLNDYPADFNTYRLDIIDTLESKIQAGDTTIDCEALKKLLDDEPTEACGGIIVS